MHKKVKSAKKFRKYFGILFAAVIILYLLFVVIINHRIKIIPIIATKIDPEKNVTIKILFAGDIFLDRGVDDKSQKSALKYSYPFTGLHTLEKEKYDAWIGNLECPVTIDQSSMFEKENYLKFSCKKEYLPELAKYFEIVSLANNHTDNMGGMAGLIETRKHLKDNKIEFFGSYNNSETEEVCKIIFIKELPITFCGFHGVYKLPTSEELKIISEYSKYFLTIVMPHQGEEYKDYSNSYQKKIYKEMIDNGADVVIGSHPHVIQEVEEYKGKLITYSLGNFIFDQYWKKTREHMVMETEVNTKLNNYKNLDCSNISNNECLAQAKNLNIVKPDFTMKYRPIFTEADMDYITKKREMSDESFNKLLRRINFDKVASSSKIQ